MSDSTLPSGWKLGYVSDIAIINPSVGLDGLHGNDEVTFITMADVGENGRILNPQIRLLREVRNGFTRFQEGDVLFAKITPCMQNGKGGYAIRLRNLHGFGSTEFHVIRANELGDPNFLSHLTMSKELRSKAIAFFSGSAGQQRVSIDFFSRYPLLIPTRPEQRKIARILTTVDNLIEKTEALIAKYQAIKQGMMHDLFTQGVDEHGHLRPPYEEAPELYKQSELGWIPKEWEVSTLETSTERVIVGLALSVTEYYRERGIPLIRNQNIRRGFFEDDDMLYLDPAFAVLFPNKKLLPADVLTVRTGANVGDTSLVPEKYVGCLTFTTLITTTNKEMLCSPYMVNYLDSSLGLTELNRLLVGGGKENLNVGEFVKMRIPLPKVSEQQACVEALERVATGIESELISLRKLSKIKTGLMQDLLTGKVRVNADELAEVES
jgi:type I restriction enzyme S subunit